MNHHSSPSSPTPLSSLSFETIKVEEHAPLLVIFFQRPHVFQAMNRLMKHELCQIIQLAEEHDHIKGLLLTAEGKAFCSGQDLQDRSVVLQKNENPQLGKTLEEEWNPLVRGLRYSSKIIISYINGVCAGAGISVALACDLIYAKAEARFVSGFAQIGLCPDAGQSYHLVRALGRAKAIEFSLNGRPFTAQDFYQAGLVNGLFEHYEQVLQHWKEPLTHLAPLSLKAIKKNFHLASEHSFEHVLKQETEMQQMLGGSHDFHEGVRAFIEKRKPQFSGR